MVDLHINSGLKCVDQGGLLSPGDITGLESLLETSRNDCRPFESSAI